jgi:hypothetical protein
MSTAITCISCTNNSGSPTIFIACWAFGLLVATGLALAARHSRRRKAASSTVEKPKDPPSTPPPYSPVS